MNGCAGSSMCCSLQLCATEVSYPMSFATKWLNRGEGPHEIPRSVARPPRPVSSRAVPPASASGSVRRCSMAGMSSLRVDQIYKMVAPAGIARSSNLFLQLCARPLGHWIRLQKMRVAFSAGVSHFNREGKTAGDRHDFVASFRALCLNWRAPNYSTCTRCTPLH